MKTIEMKDLKKGDVFTHELKLNGREAFLVVDITQKQVVCESRNTKKVIKKTLQGMVILLRENAN